MKLYSMKIKGREGMVKVIQPTQREKDFLECARRLYDKVLLLPKLSKRR